MKPHPLHGKKVPGHPTLIYRGPNAFISVRVQVPPELVKIMGKRELTKGLGTACEHEAVRRSHGPIENFHRTIEAAWAQVGNRSERILEQLSRATLPALPYHAQQSIAMLPPVNAMPVLRALVDETPAMPLAGFPYRSGLAEWVASKGTMPPAETTQSVYLSHLTRFFAWLGHDEMGRVTEQNIIDYPGVLLAGADGGKPLDNKSNNNNMGSIRAVFRVAKAKRKIASDPTVGNIHKLPVAKKSKRIGFDREQHARIVPLSLQSSDPVVRWHWSLNAFWGARIGEIADAKVSAVRTLGKHVVFDISPKHRVNGLALKTEESARILPIHSVPLRAGFLDYVAERRALVGDDGPLFDLKENRFGMQSHAASERCMGWLRDVVGITDPNLVFHSFRHSIKTFLGGRVPDRVHNAITGHNDGSASAGYGETEIAVMARAIEKIKVAA